MSNELKDGSESRDGKVIVVVPGPESTHQPVQIMLKEVKHAAHQGGKSGGMMGGAIGGFLGGLIGALIGFFMHHM